jgi:ectoine hydroxylase-related dioxygenase (phytanoyl-CoA dioxygenase family)
MLTTEASIAQATLQFEKDGFAVIGQVYSAAEIDQIIDCIYTDDLAGKAAPAMDMYAIRRFFQEKPKALAPIFTTHLLHIVNRLCGAGYFVSKAIFFDKPMGSNWFVAWHQDLTIAVENKVDAVGFGHWTKKHPHFAVQPPTALLEDNFTIRIHLDDTNINNGALRVIAGSHTQGVLRTETIANHTGTAQNCTVEKGGVMLMKPLLLHSSARSTTGAQRRVIHIECSRAVLPQGMQWAERMAIPAN